MKFMKFMKFFSLMFLIMALPVLSLAPSPARAEIPEGVMNCNANQKSRCERFWNRQTPEIKKFLKSWAVEDRRHALTCFALHGYIDKPTKSMHACTRGLIGDQKSMTHCEKRGHEIMSEAMERCQNAYRRAHNYPLPY